MSNAHSHPVEFLPPKERRRLLPVCEPIELVFADELCEPGERTRYVEFLVDGFISLLTRIDGEPALQVGTVGRDGMLGVQLALGVREALVKGLGSAMRQEFGGHAEKSAEGTT